MDERIFLHIDIRLWKNMHEEPSFPSAVWISDVLPLQALSALDEEQAKLILAYVQAIKNIKKEKIPVAGKILPFFLALKSTDGKNQ